MNDITDFFDHSLSAHFQQVTDLFYQPSIGSHYRDSEHRVLLVAESVPNWAKEPGSSYYDQAQKNIENQMFAQQVIKEHGLYDLVEKGGIKASRLLRPYEKVRGIISNEERYTLYRNLAFWEFVQRPMSSMKDRPHKKDYALGAKVLKELLKILKPHEVHFLGSDVEKYEALKVALEIPNENCLVLQKTGGTYPKVIRYLIEDQFCLIKMMRHTSMGFSPKNWQFMIDLKTLEEFEPYRVRPKI